MPTHENGLTGRSDKCFPGENPVVALTSYTCPMLMCGISKRILVRKLSDLSKLDCCRDAGCG